jgi:RND superfamily putative drug exporter
MLERLASFCYRRRGRVLLGWIVLLVVINILAGSLGSDYRADNSQPNSESQDVQELLERASPNRAGFEGQIVFRDKDGVSDPRVRDEMESLFADVDRLRGVGVASPYAARNDGQVSGDGKIAFAELQVSDRDYQAVIDLGNRIESLGRAHRVEGLAVEYGGEMFADRRSGSLR